MNLSAKHLWNDASYRETFAKAFPRTNGTGIDTLEVMNDMPLSNGTFSPRFIKTDSEVIGVQGAISLGIGRKIPFVG